MLIRVKDMVVVVEGCGCSHDGAEDEGGGRAIGKALRQCQRRR